MRVPASTYRLQFHQEFTLAMAERLVDYLDRLGITDIYASPLTQARPGSTHGYDVTDPGRINPEVGDYAALQSLAATLQAKNMGLLLDIVPNHMSASSDNPWWRDILRRGAQSPYAAYFDIDWSRKLLLPVLGKPYGETLDSGELQVRVEAGEAVLRYYDHRLPIAVSGDADISTPEGLDRALSAQPYRLAYWQKAADAINYRRFFDIGDLAGLRAELDDVFHATHAFVLKLLAEGLVTGLRIDHVDGLLDPQGYLDRLPSVYVVVEKILGGRERLPASWRVWGTTGYDFLNIVNGLFVRREGYEELKRVYQAFTGIRKSIADVFRERKRQVMDTLFAGEVRGLTTRLVELAEGDRHARDLTRQELEAALIGVTTCLPVYRTYIRPGENPTEADRFEIEDSVAAAARLFPSPAYPFLKRLLLLEPPHYLEDRREDWADFVLHWQQFTGPVMAKGLEDTTFYAYNPLLSVNEVGGDCNGPEAYLGVENFHRRMQERRTRWPFTMNAGSTHDAKRSEDVRARIGILSEIPREWARHLRKWRRWNGSGSTPDAGEQTLIYQSMLGAWPIDAARLKQYVRKALREAKVHTSWMEVDGEYEGRVLDFIDRILDPSRSAEFLEDFGRFQKKIAFHGALSSLAQTLLRMTAPGVPDFYQGTELWDYSLADPDNRRPVDFSARERVLHGLESGAAPGELLKNWQDGRIKMYLIWKTLVFRRLHPDLFLRGDYTPLRVVGSRADHVVAFARRHRGECSVTIAPRFTTALTRTGHWPCAPSIWADTMVEFEKAGLTQWTNVLTGERSDSLSPAYVFGSFPVALLYADG